MRPAAGAGQPDLRPTGLSYVCSTLPAIVPGRGGQTAGVSRSWLYRQRTLRLEIARLRDASASRPGLPSAERASTDALRQQLPPSREEITRLRTENQELREQLARHLGAARTAAVTRPS